MHISSSPIFCLNDKYIQNTVTRNKPSELNKWNKTIMGDTLVNQTWGGISIKAKSPKNEMDLYVSGRTKWGRAGRGGRGTPH